MALLASRFCKSSAVCPTTPVAELPSAKLNIIVHIHTWHLERLSHHTLALDADANTCMHHLLEVCLSYMRRSLPYIDAFITAHSAPNYLQ